jgi:hypothetical protein
MVDRCWLDTLGQSLFFVFIDLVWKKFSQLQA